jgi:hypothetical protein
LPTNERLARTGSIQWVPIEKMRVSPLAQRELRQSFVDYLVAEFDPDQIGYPLLSHRDGWYYIVDGQHRVNGVKGMGWEDQQLECEVLEGLNEAEEAEIFLVRNKRLNVSGRELFKVGVVAGREEEISIQKVAEKNGYHTPGLNAGASTAEGYTYLHCLAALRTIYRDGGEALLDRVLKLVVASYGQDNTGNVIKGFGLLCQRYGDALDDDYAAERLSRARGGSRGLIQRANGVKRATGRPIGHCVAAAAVDTINGGRGGRKMPNWWAS